MKYKDGKMNAFYDWFNGRFVEPEVCDPQEIGLFEAGIVASRLSHKDIT